MATRAQNISDSIDQIAARIKEVTASAAPDYSVGNRSVSKAAYLAQLVAQYNALLGAETTAGGPFEIKTQGHV